MNAVYWTHFTVSALFGLGLVGFLVRRNALIVFMSLELMLNAVNLILVEAGMRSQSAEGTVFVVFVITVAAAEAGIGLGLILNLYHLKGTVQLDRFTALQG